METYNVVDPESGKVAATVIQISPEAGTMLLLINTTYVSIDFVQNQMSELAKDQLYPYIKLELGTEAVVGFLISQRYNYNSRFRDLRVHINFWLRQKK